MGIPEERLFIIKEILRTSDEDLIERIKKELRNSNCKKDEKNKLADNPEISFNEWLKQYEDSQRDENEFLPEYNMTLGEFRRYVFEQERKSFQ